MPSSRRSWRSTSLETACSGSGTTCRLPDLPARSYLHAAFRLVCLVHAGDLVHDTGVEGIAVHCVQLLLAIVAVAVDLGLADLLPVRVVGKLAVDPVVGEQVEDGRI